MSKNIEKEALIMGLIPKLYIVQFITRMLALVGFLIYLILQFVASTVVGWVVFILSLGMTVGVFMVMEKAFKKISGRSKYHSFKKSRSVLSNKELLREV